MSLSVSNTPAALCAHGPAVLQYRLYPARRTRPDDDHPDAGAFELTP